MNDCFQPSIRTGRSARPPALACQPALKFSFTVRYDVRSASTSTRRSCGVHVVTRTYDARTGGVAPAPPDGSTTAESIRYVSKGTGSSVFAPARRRTVRHAEKRSGLPASRSPNVPSARVRTVLPSIRSFGPSPHGSDTGACGEDRSFGTCGIAMSVTCGLWSGNRSVRARVRIAANRSVPSAPITPSRHCALSPSTRSFARPAAPGGRLIVTRDTEIACRQVRDSDASVSPTAGTQVVAGSSSRAERAMPAGSLVAVELAVMSTLRCGLTYRWIRLVSMSAAVPVSRALVAVAAGKIRSKANPSSSCRWSRGEQTHRTEPGMHPARRPGARAMTAVPAPGVEGRR